MISSTSKLEASEKCSKIKEYTSPQWCIFSKLLQQKNVQSVYCLQLYTILKWMMARLKMLKVKIWTFFKTKPSFHFKRHWSLLWTDSILTLNLAIFLSSDLKLHNRYCHNPGLGIKSVIKILCVQIVCKLSNANQSTYRWWYSLFNNN